MVIVKLREIIKGRCSNRSKFAVKVNLESTVDTFKAILADKCDVPANQQRLIYKGRILKDDQSLQTYVTVGSVAGCHTQRQSKGLSLTQIGEQEEIRKRGRDRLRGESSLVRSNIGRQSSATPVAKQHRDGILNMTAYQLALHSQVDCIEIDVSRSSDGLLFAFHDRDLQRISGNNTSKVGHLSMRESRDLDIPTIEEALKLVSDSVQQVILNAKVGPPLYEKGLAKDILSVVERTQCKNCLVWAKSDTLVREITKLSSETMVGYVVMIDQFSGVRTNLLRIKAAGVVGVYHPLIDKTLVRILHGYRFYTSELLLF
ncbi:hypothetical protein ACFE04_027513 [Oxalis oulophora]